MTISDIDKVKTVFEGFQLRDPEFATQYMHPSDFINHLPMARDGVEGVKEIVRFVPVPEQGAPKPASAVIRAFQDGPYVFTHAKGDLLGEKVFFDIFRFDDGLIVEHWACAADWTAPNAAGHSLVDGPVDAGDHSRTEDNKKLVREFYDVVFVGGDIDRIADYCTGERFIRHAALGGDGVAVFIQIVREHSFEVEDLAFVLGEGDFVLAATKGKVEGQPCVSYDLYRLADGKIAEHWGIIEPIPAEQSWNNLNGML